MGCTGESKIKENSNESNNPVVIKSNINQKKNFNMQNQEIQIQKVQNDNNNMNQNNFNNKPETTQQNKQLPQQNSYKKVDNPVKKKVISKEEMMSYKNLPNYDLFEKFINIKKVKEYLEDREIIDGIFDEIKPLIKELFNRFKIQFEIITKNQVIDCVSYKVELTASTNQENLDNYFPLFFLNFWHYPAEAFHHRIIKKFIFCDQLMFTTPSYSQPRAACPEWYKTSSMIYSMEIQSNDYLAEVMHHELFHYFDYMISHSRVDNAIESDWSKLNPPGFQYGSGGEYERVYVDINKKDNMYFVTHYAMSQCCEDRAETYARLMTKNSNWYNEQSKVVKMKLEKLKDFMKKRHDTIYIGNNDNYYYERLQNYLDTYN